LASHPSNHVERFLGPAPQRQFQHVRFDPFFYELLELILDRKESIGRTQPFDALVGSPVVVVFNPQFYPVLGVFKAVELRSREKLSEDRLPEPFDLA
jgi:hypothetical protein